MGSHWSAFFANLSTFSTPSFPLRDVNGVVGVAGDLGNGLFSTILKDAGWSPLDLYIMGFRSEGEVPDFFYVRNPSVTIAERDTAGNRGEPIQGQRVDLTIAQVKQGATDGASNPTGVRIPDVTLAQRNFRIAFVLLIDPLTQTNANLGATDDQIKMAQLFAAA